MQPPGLSRRQSDADRAPAKAPPLSALLLSGGQAERFGGEKGLAPFRGTTLAAHVLATLEKISDDVWISTNQPGLYSGLGKPMVADRYRGQGPLAGLHAGLRAVRHELLAVAPCDMPFASAALFLYMRSVAADHDVVVPTYPLERKDPSAGTGATLVYEPLHALYSRRCLPAIEAALAAGSRRVQSWYGQVRVREVPWEEWRAVPGVGPEVFANVNTRGDLKRLRSSARPEAEG